jgi:hypothetical protein
MFTPNESCEWNPIWDDYFSEVSSSRRLNACQVRAGNSCGSGSFVGLHNGGALVLSNAHVTGSKVGSTSTFRFDPSVSSQVRSGRIIMAGYSTRVTADWSVSLIPDWVPTIKPAWCSRQRPTGSQSFMTTGSPSCVWPLRHQSGLQLLSNNNAGFAVWNQPAVPGMSGSPVWDIETLWQQLLLTWRTGNGNGAGQPLDYIWGQAQAAIQTGVLIGGPKPDDVEELSDIHPDCEEGFFAEMSLRSLPIWAEDQRPEPTEPDNPNEPCLPKSSQIEAWRRVQSEAVKMIAELEGQSDVPVNPPAGPTFGL